LAASWLRPARGVIDGLGELVLPSGRTLGHRSLRSIYRQHQKSDDTRVSVAALRQHAYATRRVRLLARMRTGGGAHNRARPADPTQLATAHGALASALAMRAADGKRHQLLLASFSVAKGTSKALAANYVHKASFADNKHARAIQHHGYGSFGGGAHYTMAGSRQFQRGVRVKGVVSRHSVQGARVGAARRAKAAAKGSSS
jgi:hypothetical protein